MKIKYWHIELLVIGSLVVFPIIIGGLAEDDLIPGQAWIKQAEEKSRTINKVFKDFGGGFDPYKEAKKGSFLWEEFLEEIDNLGIGLDDPDAVEIWETKYQ